MLSWWHTVRSLLESIQCANQVTNLDHVAHKSNGLSPWPQLLLINNLDEKINFLFTHIYKQTALERKLINLATIVHVHPN